MPVYIEKSGDLVKCYWCLTYRQTTENRATQLVYSIKFKLSHAISPILNFQISVKAHVCSQILMLWHFQNFGSRLHGLKWSKDSKISHRSHSCIHFCSQAIYPHFLNELPSFKRNLNGLGHRHNICDGAVDLGGRVVVTRTLKHNCLSVSSQLDTVDAKRKKYLWFVPILLYHPYPFDWLGPLKPEFVNFFH